MSHAALTLLLLAGGTLTGACRDPFGNLPEPQAVWPELPEPAGSLDPVRLLLAAEEGDVRQIEELRRSNGEIAWEGDGAVAVAIAARRGRIEVVDQLLSYGACAEAARRCYEALSEARARDEDAVVALLESSLPEETR